MFIKYITNGQTFNLQKMTRSCELDQDEELFNVGNIEGVKRSLQDSVMSIKMSMMHPT